MKPGLRTLVLSALMLGLALLAGLLLAEVGLRVFGKVDRNVGARLVEFDPMRVQVEPHGTAGYRQRPNAELRYDNGTVAHANSLGFRGAEITREKPAGVTRVVLLGGSTTHGWGVNDGETIDAHMTRALAGLVPGRRFEVINAAMDGYDSWQLLQRLQSDVLGLDPDVLIFNAGINDVRNAPFAGITDADPRTLLWEEVMQRLRHEALHGPALWTRLKHYSLLLRLPSFLRQRAANPQGAAPPRAAGAADSGAVREPPIHMDAADYFERNLRRMAELARRHGSAVILATPASSLRSRYRPDERSNRGYWIRDAATTQVYRDSLAGRLRRVAASLDSAGVRSVYLRPEVPAAEFLDDAHLTSEGNRIVAGIFARAALDLLR